MLMMIIVIIGCLGIVFLGLIPILAILAGVREQSQYERSFLEYQQNKRGEIR